MRPQEGKTYAVRYKQQSGNYKWYEWVMTATYLGHHRSGDEIITAWNLRPLAGTTELPASHISQCTPVTSNGGQEHKLPKRLKGNVNAP